MPAPLTPSEQLVYDLCRRSCLSLWSYNNPQNSAGKELCDVLVVFEDHIIFVSVKDVDFKNTTRPEVGHDRWTRRAIEDSIRQIQGAERTLGLMNHVLRSDGSLGIALPENAKRIVHRIAVAFGDRGEAAICSGERDQGFVHVMNETSIRCILTELDTISDLIEYLTAKENIPEGQVLLSKGSERDILAFYLRNARSLAVNGEILVFDHTNWERFTADPLYRNRKEADRVSYKWDRLIETLSECQGKTLEGPPMQLNDLECVLRVLAKETRLNRRVLAEALLEFLAQGKAEKTDSRIMRNYSGRTLFVLTYFHCQKAPKERTAEVLARCHVARAISGIGDYVVGVGFLEDVSRSDYELTFGFFDAHAWTEKDTEESLRLGREADLFASQIRTERHHDEYPA